MRTFGAIDPHEEGQQPQGSMALFRVLFLSHLEKKKKKTNSSDGAVKAIAKQQSNLEKKKKKKPFPKKL